MFGPKEHLLGESAFAASSIMAPPFKSNDADFQTSFNALLAKPRVKSEHCIGILKGRFPYLRSVCLQLGNSRDMLCIVDHVRAVVVLHNFLVDKDIEE